MAGWLIGGRGLDGYAGFDRARRDNGKDAINFKGDWQDIFSSNRRLAGDRVQLFVRIELHGVDDAQLAGGERHEFLVARRERMSWTGRLAVVFGIDLLSWDA